MLGAHNPELAHNAQQELSDEKIDVRFVEVDVEREKSSAGFQALCHCSGIVMFRDDAPPDVGLA